VIAGCLFIDYLPAIHPSSFFFVCLVCSSLVLDPWVVSPLSSSSLSDEKEEEGGGGGGGNVNRWRHVEEESVEGMCSLLLPNLISRIGLLMIGRRGWIVGVGADRER
jgi:hypothetical protein